MNNVEEIKKLREQANNDLQDRYNQLIDYEAKLKFIYNLVLQSQSYYLAYKSIGIFNNNYLDDLINLLHQSVCNDDDFINFINNNIVSKIDNGHLFIYPFCLNLNSALNDGLLNVTYFPNSIIIKIPSFSKSNLEKDKLKFKEINEYLALNNVDNIILDIRGNGGGTDSYFNLFDIFTEQEYDFEDAFYDIFIDKIVKIKWNPISLYKATKKYNRFVLVDDKVFSSAETFVRFCKQSHYATVAGIKTRGEGAGMNPFKLQITDKNYLFFPTSAPINNKNEIDYDNCYNTIPDIECNSQDVEQFVTNVVSAKKDE